MKLWPSPFRKKKNVFTNEKRDKNNEFSGRTEREKGREYDRKKKKEKEKR